MVKLELEYLNVVFRIPVGTTSAPVRSLVRAAWLFHFNRSSQPDVGPDV